MDFLPPVSAAEYTSKSATSVTSEKPSSSPGFADVYAAVHYQRNIAHRRREFRMGGIPYLSSAQQRRILISKEERLRQFKCSLRRMQLTHHSDCLPSRDAADGECKRYPLFLKFGCNTIWLSNPSQHLGIEEVRRPTCLTNVAARTAHHADNMSGSSAISLRLR